MRLESLELEGSRVRLIPVNESHAAALFESTRDTDIFRYFPFDLTSEECVRDYIVQSRRACDRGEGLTFAVVSRATGEIAGSTSYLAVTPAHRRLEIGATWLHHSFQRTAANTECKLLLLGHAFEGLGCRRVEFKTDSRNTRSRTALIRLGAVEEGTLRHHMRLASGDVRDSTYYSILADEWPAVKTRLEGMLIGR